MRKTRVLLPRQAEYSDAIEKAKNALKAALASTSALETTEARLEVALSIDDAAEGARIDTAADELRHLSNESEPESAEAASLEAIILEALRPSLFIREHKILDKNEGLNSLARSALAGMDLDFEDRTAFEANRAQLEAVARSAGRLDIFNGFRVYAGSGWLVDEDIVVTNRHVAMLFARQNRFGEWKYSPGRMASANMTVAFNNVAQVDTEDDDPVNLGDILYIASGHEPDMALIRLKRKPSLAPIVLAAQRTKPGQPVAVVGYPDNDPRQNDPRLITQFFGTRFGVKRFAPGRLMDRTDGTREITYDASTLGGNSGSVILALDETNGLRPGEALGLHFQGEEMEANTAVAAHIVAAALRRVRTLVAGGGRDAPIALAAGGAGQVEVATSPADAFERRNGYDPNFLGVPVAIPGYANWEADLAWVNGNAGDYELAYTNFSVVQNARRRLPLVTAVNIDGNRLRRIPRKGTWRLDGRLKEDEQAGTALYAGNPLDRGHMVRRLDPCWGAERDIEMIRRAEADTFHYTNSAPQHEGLNQKDWVGLEDYILDSAEKYKFLVSVFTGPIFREDDEPMKVGPDIGIPAEFWKVAVMREPNGKLSATGYILSHGPLIEDLLKTEFVLGQYETYQVPITLIATATNLDFAALVGSDPLAVPPGKEATFGTEILRVTGPDSLVLERA